MDLSSFSGILDLLRNNGYAIMFIVMLIEGAMVTYVAAFAASQNIFNIYIVAILAILGNTIGDIPFYLIGKFSRGILKSRFFRRFGLKKSSIKRFEENYKTHLGKTLAVVKITPGLPTPGLILAGVANVPFWKYMLYSFIIAVPATLFFVFAGFYSGIAFSTIENSLKITEIAVLSTIAIAVLLWYLYKYVIKRLVIKFKVNGFN
jgi:membrane protein DedA with SNARE-associated domain